MPLLCPVGIVSRAPHAAIGMELGQRVMVGSQHPSAILLGVLCARSPEIARFVAGRMARRAFGVEHDEE